MRKKLGMAVVTALLTSPLGINPTGRKNALRVKQAGVARLQL